MKKKMKQITLICGNESVIKFFYDNEIFENTEDLHKTTPRIFKQCSKDPKKNWWINKCRYYIYIYYA